MLAANLPVCQYAGMPGQGNNPNNVTTNSNNNSGGNANGNNVGNANNTVGVVVSGGTSTTAAKNQLEQLNTMREALFSQDGWGCQHVNQDTNWEVPSSPEPPNKDPTTGPALWKPTVNNGTDLWETNLRNGGQPPTQTVQKTPWGHTPSSNLGGTWGEDDDGTDSTSVWTGNSNNPSSGNVNVVGVSGAGVLAGTGVSTSGSQWNQSGVNVCGNVVGGNNPTGSTTGSIANVAAAGTPNSVGVSGVSVAGSNAAGGTVVNNGNGWGDPRDIRGGPMGSNTIDMRVDPRDSIRAASAGDPRDLRMLDPRDPIRGDPRGISGRLNGTSEMWGQHHSIVHSQMTNINKMVGAAGVGTNNAVNTVVPAGNVSNIGQGINVNPSCPVSGNVNTQWGTSQTITGPKDLSAIVSKQQLGTGWEEPSPPPQRRNMPNYDDGTSLWGQQTRVPGGGSHWKDAPDPMNRNHIIRNAIGTQSNSNIVPVMTSISGSNNNINSGPSGNLGAQGNVIGSASNASNQIGPQSRIPNTVGGVSGQHKSDSTLWVHPTGGGISGRTASSWGDDTNHTVGSTANWVDDKSNTNLTQLGATVSNSGNSWTDSASSWNKNQSKMSNNTSNWGPTNTSDTSELGSDWSTQNSVIGKNQQKLGSVNLGVGNLSADMIKQKEAAEFLRNNVSLSMDNWRRHDESLASYADHSNAVTSSGFPGRFAPAGAQASMPFPPNNLLANMGNNNIGTGATNPNMVALNAIQPLQVQKYLNQGPHNVAGGPPSVSTAVAFGQGGNVAIATVNSAPNSNTQPSAQQLRILVQQIQLAVQNGYLSSQILNQPLAPNTLLLLNQLLTNIKHLQGAQQSLARGNNVNNLQLNIAINKYTQQIQHLQKQINVQQAIYIKQQAVQQNPHPTHVGSSNTDYIRGQHDTINALPGAFNELNINKVSAYQGTSNQQSRLNQWKLPVLDNKDITSDSTDFSRAPGAIKQGLTTTTNTIGSLGLQSDGNTWSSGRSVGDGWPDSSNDNENKDWSVAQPASATTYTDLVQEFEPGKPWKIKNIEDDPSITPGSVARSPLSINPTPKDADLFANATKTSPTDLPPLSLSSSTWSFNPSANNQTFSSWSDNSQQSATSELWATPMSKTSRGPPPGLSTNKNGGSGTIAAGTMVNQSSVICGNSNGWLGNSTVRTVVPNANVGWTSANNNWNSNWLLLKNLNSQVDGSTLRTLCLQHGPLLTFHLYLNQGIALCKYATREEASKAQMTLNNCALGNTSICAESPNEAEVQNILQHLPQISNQTGTPIIPTSNSSSSNSNVGSGSNGPNTVSSTINSNNGGSNSANSSNIVGTGNNNGSSNSGASTAINVNVNSSNSNSVTTAASTTAIGGSSNTWRQAQSNQQNQQQQQASRSSDREPEYDIFSNFVRSLVDE